MRVRGVMYNSNKSEGHALAAYATVDPCLCGGTAVVTFSRREPSRFVQGVEHAVKMVMTNAAQKRCCTCNPHPKSLPKHRDHLSMNAVLQMQQLVLPACGTQTAAAL